MILNLSRQHNANTIQYMCKNSVRQNIAIVEDLAETNLAVTRPSTPFLTTASQTSENLFKASCIFSFKFSRKMSPFQTNSSSWIKNKTSIVCLFQCGRYFPNSSAILTSLKEFLGLKTVSFLTLGLAKVNHTWVTPRNLSNLCTRFQFSQQNQRLLLPPKSKLLKPLKLSLL